MIEIITPLYIQCVFLTGCPMLKKNSFSAANIN